MRILVFSDTHGMIENCKKTIQKIRDVDMIIHAGDVSKDAIDIQNEFPDIPVKFVRGNCEISQAPLCELIECEGFKIFVTHGQQYDVKNESSFQSLVEQGKSIEADVVVFGHTHTPTCDNLGYLTLLNPGSAKFGGTYGVIEIENGKIACCVLDI